MAQTFIYTEEQVIKNELDTQMPYIRQIGSQSALSIVDLGDMGTC